jgi:hypothetical protein
LVLHALLLAEAQREDLERFALGAGQLFELCPYRIRALPALREHALPHRAGAGPLPPAENRLLARTRDFLLI